MSVSIKEPSVLQDIDTKIKEASTLLTRFLYCDTSAMLRGKTTHVKHLKNRMNTGIGLVKGMMAMNMLDHLQVETGLGAVGEVRLVPDPQSFIVLPYVEGSAAMFCDMLELDHTPWSFCPRSLLKRQVEAAKEMNISFKMAFEPEFMVGYKPDVVAESEGVFNPIEQSLCFSTEGMNKANAFINGFIDAMERQNVSVEQYYPELGHGQHEVSIAPQDPVRAADSLLIYRDTLKGVAFNHDLIATMAPKPVAEQAGNGCHLHLSAWDLAGQNNLFYKATSSGAEINGGCDSEQLSDFAKGFTSGLLEHLPAIVALSCASVNSYRRLKPSSWSSAFVCWGFENREAAVRVPSTHWGNESNSTNLEIKCVDASCNPYLTLTAVIAAGLDGLKNKYALPEPIAVDPGSLTLEQLRERNIRVLPRSLEDALEALDQDDVIKTAIGSEFAKVYTTVKRSEITTFAAKGAPYEFHHHQARL